MTTTIDIALPEAREPDASPGDTLTAAGQSLRELPNWDAVKQVWVWRCGPAVQLEDDFNERHPDELSLQAWVESYLSPESLHRLDQQFPEGEEPAA